MDYFDSFLFNKVNQGLGFTSFHFSFHFHFINIYTHEYLSARKINTNNNIFLERKQNNFKNCCSTKGSCLGPVGSKDTL